MDEGNACFFLGFIALVVVLMIVGWRLQRGARPVAEPTAAAGYR